MFGGRNIRNELSQYLFNNTAVSDYIQSVNAGTPLSPPSILIEIYFNGTLNPTFEGNGNTDKANSVEGLEV